MSDTIDKVVEEINKEKTPEEKIQLDDVEKSNEEQLDELVEKNDDINLEEEGFTNYEEIIMGEW